MTGIESGNPPAPQRKTIYSLLTTLVVAACLILPVMFWSGTWFGRRLNDEQLTTYLAATGEPRKLQHALTEITERISKGDGTTRSFYPAVVLLAKHKSWQVRNTTAWVMGWDDEGEEFRESLLQLLSDPILVVRHNAALALINFDDDAGREIILSMLEPTPVISTHPGVISDLLPVDAPVRVDLGIAKIELTDKRITNLKAPMSGRISQRMVNNGDAIKAGDMVYEIQPGERQLTQALQALSVIGKPEDRAVIGVVQDRRTTSPQVAKLSTAALEAIQLRSESPANPD